MNQPETEALALESLTEADRGRFVIYERPFSGPERGRIKSWTKHWVFVVYRCNENWDRFEDYTAQATSAADLRFENA